MNLHGKKWLSLVVEDGMILTTHTQKQISVNRTPTVFNSKHIRIICLFERYGFSSQYEQLMRWETWSSLERERYIKYQMLAQDYIWTFYNTEEGKKNRNTGGSQKESCIACMESVKSYRTQKAEERLYVRFTRCLKLSSFSLEQLRTLQHRSIC